MSLRSRLRRDTRSAHDRVDAAFAACDVAQADGLARFLAAHASVYATLPGGPRTAPGWSARMARLRSDLGVLGCRTTGRIDGPPLLGDAVDYVVLGSHLGLRVLRARWARSGDPAVRAAGTYLTGPECDDRAGWSALCDDLAARDDRGPSADAVVADAVALFARFEAAARGDLVTGTRADA